jgi:hypothetical protein
MDRPLAHFTFRPTRQSARVDVSAVSATDAKGGALSSHGEPGDDAHIEAMVAGFRAAGEFFSGLGDAKQARRVLKALRSEDPAEMRRLFDKVPPFPGKCLALCGTVRVIVEGEELRPVKLCMLKPGLTATQLLMARRIYEKYFGPMPRVVAGTKGGIGEVVTSTVADVIWPSAYQEELAANDLVHCWTEMVSFPTWSLGPPTWECADLCV